MSEDQERSLRRAAQANRERLAVAHRKVVMEEEAKKAADVRENMERLKEQRLATMLSRRAVVGRMASSISKTS